jgi:Porin PorA
MSKSVSIAGIALGLLLVLAAGGLRFLIAPARAVLPADTNTTRNYTGTAALLLNPSALTSPAGGPLLLRNLPITVVHQTKTLAAKGSNARVSDAKTVKALGATVAAVDYNYAVNRTDMTRGSGYDNVVKQTGITFNWPIRTQKQDYTGWVSDTRRTTSLHYTGTATRGGIATDVFTTTTAPALITDPQVLSSLPQSLPKSTLVLLAAGLNLPASQLAALRQILPTLPDPIKFSYTYQISSTYWVAPASGNVVDLQQHEVRTLALALGGATAAPTPLTPVMDISFAAPATTLAAAAKDARHNDQAVTLIYTTVPLALLLGGAALILLGGIALALTARRPTPPTSTTPGTPGTTGTPGTPQPVHVAAHRT